MIDRFKCPTRIACIMLGVSLSICLCGTGIWYADQQQKGLRGDYYTNANWSGKPKISRRDNTPYLKGDTGYNLLSSAIYSVKWSGWLLIPKSGRYHFSTNSDDGSYLRINGETIVDNGGAHGMKRVSGTIDLEKGIYPLEVLYFQVGGFSVIQTFWTPPKGNEQQLPAHVLFAQPPGRIAILFRTISMAISAITGHARWILVLSIGIIILVMMTAFRKTDAVLTTRSSSVGAAALWRYERKIVVTAETDSAEIEEIIRQNPGMFSEIYQERVVNSIYLDTPDYDYYHQSVSGANHRRKVRIRWYGIESNVQTPSLEIKKKTGAVNSKDIYPFPAFSLDTFSWLDYLIAVEASELPASIKILIRTTMPVVKIAYSRKYFLSGDRLCRVTLDSQIHCHPIYMLDSIPEKGSVDTNKKIIELKYDVGAEDMTRQYLSFFPFRISRHSKYTAAIETIHHIPLL